MPPRDFHVLIVGGGLGGLFLALMLEHAGVSYLILERYNDVKPVGTAFLMNSTFLRAMDQLGLIPDIAARSMISRSSDFYNADMKPVGNLVYKLEERYGYPAYFILKHDLYNILLSRISPNRVVFRKRVLNMTQQSSTVSVQCADNSIYQGDLLVGADGAFSAIRQNMFAQLKAEGRLPKSDMATAVRAHHFMVGNTEPLTGEFAADPNDLDSNITFTVSETPNLTAWVARVSGGRVCWGASYITTIETVQQELLHRSEWNEQDAKEFGESIRHVKVPLGGTMGYLIDRTKKETMAKMTVQEQCYTTWHHGRVILIGDACHMISPTAAQGATQTFKDCISLANAIFDLPSKSTRDVTNMLKVHYENCITDARNATDLSHSIAPVFYARGFLGNLLRKAILHMPNWVKNNLIDKIHRSQPVISFLPFLPPKGSQALPPSSHDKSGRV